MSTVKINEVLSKATCLFSQEQINAALDNMAANITQDFKDKHPVILCVMIGGLMTTTNLVLRLNFPLEMDYVHATRYDGEIKAGETLTWKALPHMSLENRHVIIVDDILDGGVTLAEIVKKAQAMGAASVSTAVLVDKHHQREERGLAKADYVGLEVADHYIFGYGLDYNGYLRNVPAIYVVAPEHE